MRRRFLDLLLAQTEAAYLPLLQRYMLVVRSRNALLKQKFPDAASLESFTHELIQLGEKLMRFRRELLPRISPLARLAYRRISNEAEEFRVEYAPSVKGDFALEIKKSAERERALRATLVGPHRDDLELLVNEHPASRFASEGQKRSVAIALKIAQTEYLTGMHGTPPVILIDDIMGELDLHRRSGFLPLLDRARQHRGQVFMTCTEESWPAEIGREFNRWRVAKGTLRAGN
jgi:DNA replication and repair protein RecF